MKRCSAHLLASLMGVVFSLSVVFIAPGRARIIHVPSLEAPTIQAGIDTASAGDTVLVACGTYVEHDIAMKSGVCLRGETAQADCVTIHAQQQGRVISLHSVDSTASIEGFTFAGGQAVGQWPSNWGGGMYSFSSSPTVSNCAFSGNAATGGGGASCNGDPSPTFINCTFAGNSADCGGGIYCFYSSATLINCTFFENSAIAGGGMASEVHIGSGIQPPRMKSHHPAAGIFPLFEPTLANCTFSRNSATSGAGLVCTSTSPTLTSCTFIGNAATNGAGMFCYFRSHPAVINCSFIGNAAEAGAGVRSGVSAHRRMAGRMSSRRPRPVAILRPSVCHRHHGRKRIRTDVPMVLERHLQQGLGPHGLGILPRGHHLPLVW